MELAVPINPGARHFVGGSFLWEALAARRRLRAAQDCRQPEGVR
jgi:hypothetical protein